MNRVYVNVKAIRIFPDENETRLTKETIGLIEVRTCEGTLMSVSLRERLQSTYEHGLCSPNISAAAIEFFIL